jgi:branched-subunit amino acid transport protein AzlD
MKTGVSEAFVITFAMGAAILFCRAFPFLFFRDTREKNSGGENKAGKRAKGMDCGAAFLNFVEKTVPPVAMTVLAFNSIAAPVKGNSGEAIPVLAASVLTALVHLWKRNPLLSIFGGTALYMILERIL